MTDTTNGWPGKPGVPLNPEKDGAHRLRHQVSDLESDALWSCGGTWLDLSGDFSIPHAAAFYDYLGPCLTHDQATALQARAAELEGALRPFAELGRFVVEHHPDPETDLNHEMSALVRHFRNAHTTLEGKKDE